MSLWWRIGGIVVLAGVLFGVFKYVENIGYERRVAEDQAENLKTVTEFAKRLKAAEEQRDENQTTIDRLVTQSRSVRVHLPVCANNGTPKDQNGGTGALSNRVDESFARLQDRGTELFKRCDELNLDAIKTNATHR